LHRLFSQWHCGAEHRGRTAALKAAAYETGESLTDERNSRTFAHPDHADGKGVIVAGVRVPSKVPMSLRRESFTGATGYDRRVHMQALLSSIAGFEERQRHLHRGRNQTGHTDDRPIIGRSDVFDLDKSLAVDGKGQRRPDWRQNLTRAAEDVVREKFTRRGVPAVFSIHDEAHGNGNFHVHVTSFYRRLTPQGWAELKERPFGQQAWRDYWEDGAKILRQVQTRHLQRLGVTVEDSPRLAMLPDASRAQAAKLSEGRTYASPVGLPRSKADSRQEFDAARSLTTSPCPKYPLPRGISPPVPVGLLYNPQLAISPVAVNRPVERSLSETELPCRPAPAPASLAAQGSAERLASSPAIPSLLKTASRAILEAFAFAKALLHRSAMRPRAPPSSSRASSPVAPRAG